MKVLKILGAAALVFLFILCSTTAILYIRERYQLEGIVVLVSCSAAAFWGLVLRWLYKDGRLTVSHIIGIWLILAGTLMGGASYYLAYRGISANLETLSRYALVDVAAGAGGYMIKSGFENAIKIKKSDDRRDL